MPVKGNGYGDSKEVAGAGDGSTTVDSKEVASPHKVPVASTKTEAQRHYGHRPCDFIGYWHQDKAEDGLLREKVRRLRRSQS